MPFDAFFLTAVIRELQPLLGARVDKIQQPARDTVLLHLRGYGKLLLSANVNRPRIHLTQANFENPAQPPMFCMLLRKHLTGGRLVQITQPPAERSVRLDFDCTDELGDPCRKALILELMGRNSNLILTGSDGRILDCLRRVDFEMSEQRQVLPGLFYRDPPRQNKLVPTETDEAQILALLRAADPGRRLDKWLLDTFAGFSPLISRELCFGFTGLTDRVLDGLDLGDLANFLYERFSALHSVAPILLERDGVPVDFTYRKIFQYGCYYDQEVYISFSRLLDRFYTQTDHVERMRQKSQTLRKTVTTLRERTLRKLEHQRIEREATLDREQLRRKGDIVTANLHAITRGQTCLRAENFYEADAPEIEITLKPELSPQQNAARYYKEYAKAKTAEKILTQQLAQGEQEAEYLATVLDELSRVECEADLAEIRQELESGGYVRPTDRKKRSRLPASKPLEFTSSDGFRILVGRNNRQNDQLSLKTARKDDLWLHIQKFHGTHVILACAGVQPPDRTVTEAAMLAAFYSQAKNGQNVPVDVTQVRNLRKPNGAKPGMVVYEQYRTVIVTPEPSLPERLKAKQEK